MKKNYHYFYLSLSIVGGISAFYYSILGILDHKGSFNSLEFIQSTWTNNNYAKSISLDFWSGIIAGTFFILVEGIRLKIKRTWIYLITTFFIGFAFGFPLFLFIRHQYLQKLGNQINKVS